MLCINCHRLSPEFKTCTSCRDKQAAAHVYIASRYEGTLVEVVKAFKYGRAAGAAHALTPLLEGILPPYTWDIVVPVPSTTSHQRRRGYNPAALLAQELSVKLDFPYHPVLKRLGQTRQVGTKRAERLRQLTGQIYATDTFSGKRILLVDDIVTTGATIHTCATALRSAGAKTVDAVVLARHTG